MLKCGHGMVTAVVSASVVVIDIINVNVCVVVIVIVIDVHMVNVIDSVTDIGN